MEKEDRKFWAAIEESESGKPKVRGKDARHVEREKGKMEIGVARRSESGVAGNVQRR